MGGMQIAVPYWYSMHNIVLQMGLRKAGLVPVIKDQGETLAPNEVNLMVMPPPEMPPALAAKKIDAFTVAEPFNAMGELKAGGKVIIFKETLSKRSLKLYRPVSSFTDPRSLVSFASFSFPLQWPMIREQLVNLLREAA